MIVRTLIQPTVPLKQRHSLTFRLIRAALLGIPLAGLVALAIYAVAYQVREERARQEFNELEAGQFSRDREQLTRADVPAEEMKRVEKMVEEINRARRTAGAQAGPVLRDLEDAISEGTRLERLDIDAPGRGVQVSISGTASGISTLDQTMQRLGRTGNGGGILVRHMEERDGGQIAFTARGAHTVPAPAPSAPPAPRPPPPRGDEP